MKGSASTCFGSWYLHYACKLLRFAYILSNVSKAVCQDDLHQFFKTYTDAHRHLEKPYKEKNNCTEVD